MRRRPEFPRRAAVGAATVTTVLMLVACAGGEPAAAPSHSTAHAAPSATASPSVGADPAPAPADALPLFTSVVLTVWSSDGRMEGRAYIDALVAAGFDKGAMQVTDDTSTVGNEAESLQFSVLWGEECLVGQVGSATGEPVTTVLPATPGGTCLIGRTRPIDW